jgi:hypothetical protein
VDNKLAIASHSCFERANLIELIGNQALALVFAIFCKPIACRISSFTLVMTIKRWTESNASIFSKILAKK